MVLSKVKLILGSNFSFIYFDITVQEWGQSACIKWTSKQIIDCDEWDDGYILNRKTGEWIPVLTVYSLGSIKIIGIFLFFIIAFFNLPVSREWKFLIDQSTTQRIR